MSVLISAMFTTQGVSICDIVVKTNKKSNTTVHINHPCACNQSYITLLTLYWNNCPSGDGDAAYK